MSIKSLYFEALVLQEGRVLFSHTNLAAQFDSAIGRSRASLHVFG